MIFSLNNIEIKRCLMVRDLGWVSCYDGIFIIEIDLKFILRKFLSLRVRFIEFFENFIK